MKAAEARARAKRQRRLLLVCLVITGACALVLEVLGARLVSPFFGASIFTWSGLITVTLAALAFGYHWGGRLADRTPTVTLAARLLAAAAFAVAAVPSLRVPVLKAAAPLGVQGGAVVAALLLLAPALVLLSALGPLAVRLFAGELAEVGRSTGEAYAVSTVGSVAGASLAGFVLIPHVPVSQILYGMSALLLLLSAWAHHVGERRAPVAQLALAAAVAAFGFWPRPAEDTNIRLNRESAYGQIKVLDFNGRRYLLVNGTTQSMALLPSLRGDSQYAQVMELAAAARPKAKRALVIGLGAGLMTSALEREYGLTVDTIELDPAVAEAARRFFAFEPKGDVLIEDGRAFLEKTDRSYDLIFLDAFGSEAPPFHLFTEEAFRSMRRRLAPEGLLAVNLVSSTRGDEAKAWRSAHRTLTAVFPAVSVLLASEPIEDIGNFVFFAGAGELPREAPATARAEVRAAAAAAFKRRLDLNGAATLMTDDFAPMESLLADTSVRWRATLQKKVPEILLY